jgi:hypothetical protein
MASNAFSQRGPASRREVELLGEWLNSVLADNLESDDSPLDIVTHAQECYSIAFNELIREVSITSARRARLLAVLWKRNQDLFSKLIQIQREEREYVLECHKERVQLLKTDLEFTTTRLRKIEDAYYSEREKWTATHEHDLAKFVNFQTRIDQQTADRAALQAEIKSLEDKIGVSLEKRTEPISI